MFLQSCRSVSFAHKLINLTDLKMPHSILRAHHMIMHFPCPIMLFIYNVVKL